MNVLSQQQRRQLDELGYLVVEDVLEPERDIRPLLDEYEVVLDHLAQRLYADGAIPSTYPDVPFAQRLICLYCAYDGRLSQHFDISLPQSGIRPDTPIHLGPAVFGLLTHPRLLDLVEDVIGPEIYANPVQHIRMKLPALRLKAGGLSDGITASVPWHQDNGVILPEADDATILTVWLPLTDATVENGCLQVIPESHRAGLTPHCPGTGGLTIPTRLLPDRAAVPLPMWAGSALLMHQRTVHSSLDNLTESEVRISFDLRYQPVGQPTGRPAFPGFVARSRAHPETELRDPDAWAGSWHQTRDRLLEHDGLPFNRWRSDAEVCA